MSPKNMSPDPSTLAGLLKRVEGATGRDRVLDDAIWWRLDCLPLTERYRQLAHRTRQENVSFPTDGRPDWRALGPYTQPPPLSSSIDSALALVERVLPGCFYAIDATAPELGIDVDLFVRQLPTGEVEVRGTATTLPLAFLAALLKALQASTLNPPGTDSGEVEGG